MAPERPDLAQLVAILERVPAAFRALLEGLPESLVRGTEGGEAWSPYDVVGHLIHGEKTDWIPRLRIILEQGEARPFDSFDRSAQFEASRGRSLEDLLDEFSTLRVANLGTLAELAAAGIDCDRTGVHPELGIVTAGELLAAWAVHDVGHLAQVARTLARQQTGRVGPWRGYLPVLTRGDASGEAPSPD